jgi:hypothetical protein
MSKLNRREFKDLLLEWNKNFLNEKGEYSKYNKDKENQTGYLTTFHDSQIGKIEKYVVNYIEKNNMTEIMDVLNTAFFEGGIVFPKTDGVLNMFKSYFFESGNENKAKVIENIAKNNDDECVIIHSSSGDFTKDFESQTEAEIYYWTLHDMEHKLLSEISASPFYFCKIVLDRPEFKKVVEEKNIRRKEILPTKFLKSGTINRNYLKGKDAYLIQKFFKAINFTESAGFGDQHASVMAFCYSKMSEFAESDMENIKIDEIENLDSSFTAEEKTWLANYFKSEVYNITQNAFNELKNVFRDCVILVY